MYIFGDFGVPKTKDVLNNSVDKERRSKGMESFYKKEIIRLIRSVTEERYLRYIYKLVIVLLGE